ncbi:hypothetical protein ACQ4PT_030171 [Festuca glaucescens]
MAGFFEAVRDKMGEHVDRLALEWRPEALVIVADTFLTWAVAAELSTKSLEQYVPGLSSVRLSDLKIFSAMERAMKIVAEAFANLRKAEIPFNGDKIRDEEHRDWLDAQPENSVLYVSFGSYVSMAPSQFEEIAAGLRGSGVRFLWVARDKAAGLRQTCGGRGLALEVLCHSSVGGFLSHCVWNSVLDAVCAGVPLLAFPVVWDQLVNARMVADEWKVGIDLTEQRGDDGTVSRAAISAPVMKLMDFDSDVGREMRRAAELCEDSSRAVHEGGSSHRSLTSFLQDLVKGKPEVTETSP